MTGGITMSKIDIDKFVEHLVKCGALDVNAVQSALYAQGLILSNYTIQRIKVEPKFKVGDWVVNNNSGGVYKVTEIRDDEYCLWPLDSEIRGYLRIIDVDNEYHLWTIKDSKDGDVLFYSDSASNGIFIFKELLKYEFSEKVICYCDYDSEDHFCLGEHHTCCWADAKILHPATKEQHNLLFQKMHEAGYEWDAEKKELKKIHVIDEGKAEMDYCFTKMMNGEKVEPQSPTTTSCSEELDAKMYEACDRFFAPNTDPNKYSAADLFYAGVEAGCDLNMLSWSEEDKKMFVNIKACLRNANKDYSREVDWLKSLKDRYTWKPSDEQMNLLEELVEDNNQRYFYTILNSLYEQLKKLKGE